MFAEWFEPRNSPIPGRPLRWGEDAVLKRLLEKGINYTDYPRAPIPDLGYSVGLWNGNIRRDGAAINLSCGSFSRYVSNCVVLKLSKSEDGFPTPELIFGALKALVNAWDPDIGEVYQLFAKGEDFEELHCAGYSPKAVPREHLQLEAIGRGRIWFDQSAYERFV